MHFVPPSLAHHRPGARLRDVRQRGAGGLRAQFDRLPQAMREIKPTVFVGVPRVYEKIRQEVERRAAESAGEETPAQICRPHWRETSRGCLRRRPAFFASLETCQQAGVRQGPRSLRRPRAGVRFRRRPAGYRHGAMVRLRGDCRLGRLRSDRDVTGDRAQLASQPSHGRGGQAASQCRDQIRRGRGIAGARPAASLPATGTSRTRLRNVSTPTAGSEPATLATSTTKASSTSPIARRNC